MKQYLQLGKDLTKKSEKEKKLIINTFVSKIVISPDNDEVELHLKLNKNTHPKGCVTNNYGNEARVRGFTNI